MSEKGDDHSVHSGGNGTEDSSSTHNPLRDELKIEGSSKFASVKARYLTNINPSTKEKQKQAGEYSNELRFDEEDLLHSKEGGILEDEILRSPEDIKEDNKYRGQMEIVLCHVPLRAIDERTIVDEPVITEWVKFALIEEDPLAQEYFDEIQKLSEQILDVSKNLQKIPYLNFTDETGQPLPQEKAVIQKEKIFEKYSNERVFLENKLEDVEKDLKSHIAWRRTTHVSLRQGDIDMVTHTCTWHMHLSGALDLDEMHDLLISKENWSGIKLACGDPKAKPEPIPPWAGRGEVPDGSSRVVPDYRTRQVRYLTQIKLHRRALKSAFFPPIKMNKCNCR